MTESLSILARHIVRNGDRADRAMLAAHRDLSPEWLVVLASDRHPMVREAVAANASAPALVDTILVNDPSEQVRVALAGKVAALSPNMPRDLQERMENLAWQTLCRLVRDTATRVRAAIADVVKSMPDAPHELIVALAHDPELSIAEPVIRLSPLLTEDDLLGLISGASAAVNLVIANRVALGEAVSDALVDTQDTEVITELLNNQSAAIREETLDKLVTRAAQQLCWQKPLATRPYLTPHAARILSEVVTDEVLLLLSERADLSPKLMQEIRQRLSMRSAVAPQIGQENSRARLETKLVASIQRSEYQRLIELLALAAHVPKSVVEYAAGLHSAKALVALCWHAGFSMTVAVALQSVLGRLPPSALLKPTPNGGYPLPPHEMRWQIDFLLRRETV